MHLSGTHNGDGLFDKCKQIFVSQKEHGEFKTATEKRFGELDADIKTYKQGQTFNRNLLIIIAGSTILDLIVSLVHAMGK